MIDQEAMTNMRGHLRDALKRIKGARWWALDQEGWDSLTMLAVGWLEARQEQGLRYADAEFGQFISQVVDAVPGLKQAQPQEPPKLPEPWLHPLTKQPLGLPATPDEKAALAKRDPGLLKLLEDLEARPYQTMASLQRQQERAQKLAAIKYTAEMHRPEINPWLIEDEHERRQKASELIKSAGQDVSDAYKAEAEPVKIPWALGGNMTKLGTVEKTAPEVWKLTHRAVQLQRERIVEQKATAVQAKNDAEARLREAERMLAAR